MARPSSQPALSQPLAITIGDAARAARTRLGLTQAEMAQRVGLASGVYSRMERGRMLPSVSTLQRLCDALGVTPDELMGHTPPANDFPARHQLLLRVRNLEESQVQALLLLLPKSR
ncbi:helix-turn-helix domain-containing protein [Corallococcus carmarthensis]|uniref:helix-turn-helix domain-containing protein n=1 Tax=Corallococcus carmarthensis TaxID=2316728 RepID=UPI00148CDE15|nr:helix-turn-helix transcriptional regulator [Corallococcus carmarthensis]NOK20788.1 helix-turn-helix transcriptional regulator [Corallococcus carmarthensis]